MKKKPGPIFIPREELENICAQGFNYADLEIAVFAQEYARIKTHPPEFRRCGRCFKEGRTTELNIEGAIHHRTPVHCLDGKSCARRARKNRQKGVK